MAQMGQSLFAPPDVSGWKEGLNWINTTFDLARFNWASGFIAAVKNERGGTQVVTEITTDALRSLLVRNNARTPDQIVDYLSTLLLQVQVSAQMRTTLINYLTMGPDGTAGSFPFDINNNTTIDNKVRGVIHLIMTAPEYQLS
jgi:hypothetical protein